MATREDRRPWEVVLKEWQLRCIYERIYSHNPSLRRGKHTINVPSINIAQSTSAWANCTEMWFK